MASARVRVGAPFSNAVIHYIWICMLVLGVIQTEARQGPDSPVKVDPAAQKEHWTHHSQQCTYTVVTHTGNVENAGTDADVNLEFYNESGESVLFVDLSSGPHNFGPGQTDTFTMVGNCVYNICKVHLSHDNAGENPSWFVNSVSVSVDFETAVFNVYEWLAQDEPPYTLSYTNSLC